MTKSFNIGDRVVKTSGDYFYEGTIVVLFSKLSGALRYVVENDDGVLMIMNGNQLEHA